MSRVGEVIQGVARWLNPVIGSPAGPLETSVFVDSFGPSLMPRTSVHQGVATGLSVLSARAVTKIADVPFAAMVPTDAGLARRLAMRGVMGGAGRGLAAIPEVEGETMWRSTARTTGLIVRAAALGGAIYDVGMWLRGRNESSPTLQPVAVTAATVGGILYWAQRRLAVRETEVGKWPIPQTSTIPAALGTSVAVTAAGSLISRGYRVTRDGWIDYLGPGWSKNVMGRVINAALWAGGGVALYNAGVGYLTKSNDKVEPGYSTSPTAPEVSGSADSVSTFEELGLQGRRYVIDVLTPEIIEETLGEPAKAHPIRAFIGFNSEPLYSTGRAEMALAELERTGAFDRSYLLLVSPTGTGWVDQTMIEAAEFLTRGDIATCCIQYGRSPSFLAVQKVALGRAQFRLLLWGIKERLRERPVEQRPKVLVFGESLGAWTSSDVVMHQGISGFDHYGIDRALWFGLPWLAKWSRSGMARGASDTVPEGTVGVFDSHEQLAALTDEERDRMRAVILSHDNDPIARFGPDMMVRKPDWVGADGLRGVSTTIEWIPIVTFCQTALDAANAMVTVPGVFESFGHDYRADTARFVRDGFHLPSVSEEQMERIEAALRSLELDRSERIKAANTEAAPPAPSEREVSRRPVSAGVPLKVEKTRGANWRRSLKGRRNH
jgi:uncharacterized membrane protein